MAEVSGRLTDYALAAIDSANAASPQTARLAALRDRAEAAFAAVEGSRQGDLQPDLQAPPGARILAHLKADFDGLDKAIGRSLALPDAAARGDAIRGSLNSFALSAAPNLSLLVESERNAVQASREALQRTSARLASGAVAVAALAVLAAIVMHRSITRPILRRVDAIAAAAQAVRRGDLGHRIPVDNHDELGLVVARFNRMAATLARRERRIVEDRAGLERTVALRTADLTAANEALEAVDRSRRRFFADVSHELRTPLTVVLGECDVALRSSRITEERMRPVLVTIRQRVIRLNRRVEDLLRVARSESGELALDIRPVELGPILVEAVEAYAKLAARDRVALATAMPEAAIEVPADREWLRQVVEGLIDNALRHATGATRVTVSLDASPDEAWIVISDDGPGIPHEAQERVFERFVRRPSAEKSGFGIGLALARWVVERHRGTITISSLPKERPGTQVTLSLPRAPNKGRDAGSNA
jgi:signal transduction histidine kinase